MAHHNTLFHQMLNFIPRHQLQALEKVYQRCRQAAAKPKFTFKPKPYFLDASMIDISLKAFPWASFRRTKSTIKRHTLLDNSGFLPALVSITDGKTHGTKGAHRLRLSKGSIEVEDRADTDYRWFATT